MMLKLSITIPKHCNYLIGAVSIVLLPLPGAFCSRACINIPQAAKLGATETVRQSKNHPNTENLISGFLSSDGNAISHFALNF
jgi:hypothetical protein